MGWPRRHELALWLIGGVTAGGAASAVVVGALVALDEAAKPWAPEYGIAAGAGVIAALYGAAGGFVVALLTHLVLRSLGGTITSDTYAGVAAGITAVLTACAIAPWLVVVSSDPYSDVPTWAWWALPLVTTPTVAALVGRAIWMLTRTRSGGAGGAV